MFHFFQNRNRSKSSSKTIRRHRPRSLLFEQVEGRQMMAGTVFNDITNIGPVLEFPREPLAEGSITRDPSTGVVTVEGSNNYNDDCQAYINHRGGSYSDLLTVSLANINLPLVAAFDPATVSQIVFRGHDGNDKFDNHTGVTVYADGGAGIDMLLGGTSDDTLIGGDGNDYLDGRAGADYLFGLAGIDALFGDDGYDSLYGGDDVDFLFGGNSDDSLYGGAGNDVLYGEAGNDRFIDSLGTNTKYTDYGPTYTVSSSGFQAFDWFDRYLKDAADRSLARQEYFQGGNLNRSDMLNLYKLIATDGVYSSVPYNGTVTSNELSDLKALLSTKLYEQNDTRWFATRIANGDPANAQYQGGSLGNLAAGNDGNHLSKLVDKWFLGGDLPDLGDTSAEYRQVNGNLFVGGPSYTDISQGGIADCYFMAPLGEVAKHSSSTIYSMFGDNGDGTWTVRFFHGNTPAYVTVNRELPVSGNYAVFAGWGGGSYTSSSNELWVALAEKAYAQLNESGWIGQDGHNSYHGIDYGWPANAFSQLTGRSASDTNVITTYLGAPVGDTQSGFISAINAGKALTLCSKSSGTNSFIVANHCYMVIGYDSSTGLFTLANPWGANSDAVHPMTAFVTWANIRHDFNFWTSVTL